jgi:acetyltransferase-like isoleucine patch superfamily enzyme
MINYFKTYSLTGFLWLVFCVIRTRLFYFNAKIIRFPIDIRNKRYIKFGKGFTTGVNCRLEAYPHDGNSTTIQIGENVQINDFVHITGIHKVFIGNNVLMASKVYISDSSHGSYTGDQFDSEPDSIPKERPLVFKDVNIGDNVWIGESVSILPGVSIGKNSIIGANSVVTKNIPDNVIAAGNPAKIIKEYNFITRKWEVKK